MSNQIPEPNAFIVPGWAVQGASLLAVAYVTWTLVLAPALDVKAGGLNKLQAVCQAVDGCDEVRVVIPREKNSKQTRRIQFFVAKGLPSSRKKTLQEAAEGVIRNPDHVGVEWIQGEESSGTKAGKTGAEKKNG